MVGGIDPKTVEDTPVWQHLRQVVAKMASERPAESLDSVEAYSRFALTGAAIPPHVRSVYQDTQPKVKAPLSAAALEDTEWARGFIEQVAPPKPVRPVDEDAEEEPAEDEDEPDKGELPDIVLEQAMLREGGEGVPDTEAYRVAVALKRLLDKEPLAKARFWGKVTGMDRDYYVAETKIDEARVPEKEEDEVEEEEPEGKAPETIFQLLAGYKVREPARVAAEPERGINEFKYYVATSDDLTKWVALPDVLPAHIVGARAIAKLFTGNLEAPVECHPPFPGVEMHYLRAQIARITHATTVHPKDMFGTDLAEEEVDEEDPQPKRFEVPAPEEVPPLNPTEAPDADDPEAVAPVKEWFAGYKDDELLRLQFWVHSQPEVLACGRSTVNKPEEEPQLDDDEDELPAPPVELIHPFLSDIEHDEPLRFDSHSRAELPAWALRKAHSGPGCAVRKYVARSLRWPGAVALAQVETDKPGAEVVHFYVGRGVKAGTGEAFCPPLPPLPCAEFPTVGVRLQQDGTYDDELEFEPAPPKPKVEGDEEEEEEEED